MFKSIKAKVQTTVSYDSAIYVQCFKRNGQNTWAKVRRMLASSNASAIRMAKRIYEILMLR